MGELFIALSHSLLPAVAVTLLVVLPYTLWLKRKGDLSLYKMCLSGFFMGGFIFAAYLYEITKFHAETIEFSTQVAVFKHALLGMLAGGVFCLFSGIGNRSAAGTEPTYHSKPLWKGLLACVLVSSIMTTTCFLFSGVLSSPGLISVAFILPFALLYSTIITCNIALPVVAWLRKRGELTYPRICFAGIITGALLYPFKIMLHGLLFIVGFPFTGVPTVSDFYPIASSDITTGAIIGMIAGAALCFFLGVGDQKEASPTFTNTNKEDQENQTEDAV